MQDDEDHEMSVATNGILCTSGTTKCSDLEKFEMHPAMIDKPCAPATNGPRLLADGSARIWAASPHLLMSTWDSKCNLVLVPVC